MSYPARAEGLVNSTRLLRSRWRERNRVSTDSTALNRQREINSRNKERQTQPLILSFSLSFVVHAQVCSGSRLHSSAASVQLTFPSYFPSRAHFSDTSTRVSFSHSPPLADLLLIHFYFTLGRPLLSWPRLRKLPCSSSHSLLPHHHVSHSLPYSPTALNIPYIYVPHFSLFHWWPLNLSRKQLTIKTINKTPK